MRRSTDRILVSHAGTLPMPQDLADLYRGYPDTTAKIRERLPGAVGDVVAKQAEVGIDVVNDGELPKRGGFSGYIRDRLGGFEIGPASPPAGGVMVAGSAGPKDRRDFPAYFSAGKGFGYNEEARAALVPTGPTSIVGPIIYVGQDALAQDIANLKKACEGLDVEACMSTTLPIAGANWRNEYYKSDEEIGVAHADALREEYRAITDAGIVLQLDNPGIAGSAQGFDTLEEYRAFQAPRIELINYALDGIPTDMVRMHTCWGGNHGPHINDVPLDVLIETILTVNVGCYNIEQANPRHEWEWTIWEHHNLPDGKIFQPGVVGHATDIVEHPELVAQRLVHYANLIGKENVMGGTDCGISARVGDPDIGWAKLRALHEGAELASRTLWG